MRSSIDVGVASRWLIKHLTKSFSNYIHSLMNICSYVTFAVWYYIRLLQTTCNHNVKGRNCVNKLVKSFYRHLWEISAINSPHLSCGIVSVDITACSGLWQLWRTTFWTRHEKRSYADAVRRYRRDDSSQTYDNAAADVNGQWRGMSQQYIVLIYCWE